MDEPFLEELPELDVPGLGRRTVRACVPPPPPDGAPLPALFMFDGQNVFDDAPSHVGGWHLHEAVRRLGEEGLPQPLVVGIHHGGPSRIDELAPWATKHGGGHASALLQALCDSLLPYVRDRFGAALDPRSTFIGGSSLGGLTAVWAHIERPETFGGMLAMSPSLWYGEGKIFRFVERRGAPRGSRVYLDAGALEDGGNLAKLTHRLATDLAASGLRHEALRIVIDERGAHAEHHWRRRAPEALRFLLTPAADEPARSAA